MYDLSHGIQLFDFFQVKSLGFLQRGNCAEPELWSVFLTTAGISTDATFVAIFPYPPVVCLSERRMIEPFREAAKPRIRAEKQFRRK